MAERSANVAVVSDYNRSIADAERWVASADGKCAILTAANSDRGAGVDFAWARIGRTIYYSCYCTPNCSTAEFDAYLAGLETSIRQLSATQADLKVAGDFNAHSAEWGSGTIDIRGTMLADFALAMGLVVCNVGSKPTYRIVNAASVIDVTLARPLPGNHPLVEDWEVLEEVYSASDHLYITFTVATPDVLPRVLARDRVSGWSVKKLNPEAAYAYWDLVGVPQSLPTGASAEDQANYLDALLTSSCDAAMPQRTAVKGKKSAHWWNSEIAELRKVAIAARRSYQRAGRRTSALVREAERDSYKRARTNLKLAIRRAQERSWQELCLSVDKDPWGVPYKLVTKRLGRRTPALNPVTVTKVARGLFPASTPTDWACIPMVVQQPTVIMDFTFSSEDDPLVPLFTEEEIKKAVLRLLNGKAPGPDLVPNEAIRMVYSKFPETFKRCYDSCIVNGVFPSRWKRAKMVLLYKGQGKAREQPSSYRPLSLLDGAGKIFERMLLNRLEPHLTTDGAISDAQHGFRRSKSTLGAIEEVLSCARRAARGPVQDRDLCVLVSLDVRNAFNTAPWRLRDKALRGCAVPEYLIKVLRSYMQDRVLHIGNDMSIPVTCGVPQGSVLGPTLWNLFYDSVLRLPLRDGVKLVAFADDLAVVAVAHNAELIEEIVSPTLNEVTAWMSENGLCLAPEKSECVVLTNKYRYRSPNLFLQGCRIPVKPAIRYLGVMLDRMSFVQHASTVAAGARKAAAALGRLMPNVGGPSQAKRQLLMSVIHSRLLYGAPIWSERVLGIQKSSDLLLQAQRCAALRVAWCYRTVSCMASLVLARMPPATLQAEGRRMIVARAGDATLTKRGIKVEILERWQTLWVSTPKAAWTRRLIPDLIRWWRYGLNQVSFHMAQVLTNHGCFQHYLWKRNKVHSAACPHCPAEVDDAEHTVFTCNFWSGERRELEQSLGRPIRPEDVMDVLCGPIPADLPEDPLRSSRILAAASRIRSQFLQMVEDIMGRKEQLERERQHAAAADQQGSREANLT